MTTEPTREPIRHPLLARQLERCAIDDVPTGEQWHDFVSRGERSYHDPERAQTPAERNLEGSPRRVRPAAVIRANVQRWSASV